MRPDHIERRIDLQNTHTQSIDRAYQNLIRHGTATITPQRIQIRLDDLENQWSAFAVNHKAIQIAVSQVNPSDRDWLMNNDYFKLDVYSTTHENYLEALEKIKSHLG